MITISEMWNFLNSTHVTEDLLHVIDPKTGLKVPTHHYVSNVYWEYRFDMNVLEKMWDKKYTFILHSSLVNKTLRDYVENLERENKVYCQAHVYFGKEGSKSFQIHADYPDNLIVQCVGKSKVTVYNEYAEKNGPFLGDKDIEIGEQMVLEPSDAIFIPSLRYHLFEPLTDRLSISFPMIKI